MRETGPVKIICEGVKYLDHYKSIMDVKWKITYEKKSLRNFLPQLEVYCMFHYNPFGNLARLPSHLKILNQHLHQLAFIYSIRGTFSVSIPLLGRRHQLFLPGSQPFQLHQPILEEFAISTRKHKITSTMLAAIFY